MHEEITEKIKKIHNKSTLLQHSQEAEKLLQDVDHVSAIVAEQNLEIHGFVQKDELMMS